MIFFMSKQQVMDDLGNFKNIFESMLCITVFSIHMIIYLYLWSGRSLQLINNDLPVIVLELG